MPTDYKYTNDGIDLTSPGDDSFWNLLRNSHVVPKGSVFFNIGFGSELYKLKREKRTENSRQKTERYSKECTQWMIDSGKAKSITQLAEFDSENKNRINLLVTGTKSNGEDVTFKTFIQVV